jgi:hypothetical protein
MRAGNDALEFREECLLLQLKCDLLETPEIAKILWNVYKGSCIAKYPLKQLFTVDLPCLLWMFATDQRPYRRLHQQSTQLQNAKFYRSNNKLYQKQNCILLTGEFTWIQFGYIRFLVSRWGIERERGRTMGFARGRGFAPQRTNKTKNNQTTNHIIIIWNGKC